MSNVEPNVAALVNEMPNADKPGEESKFTGPKHELAEKVATQIIAGGDKSVLELIDMIVDGVGGGAENYKPGYVLRCLSMHVGKPGKEAQRKVLVSALAKRLGGETPSKDVQGFLIRELQVAGGKESVELLGKLLRDNVLCEYAAQALIAIGDGAADQLRAAFPKAKKNRLTIIHALGTVVDEKSVGLLKKVIKRKNENLKAAAGWALANIGAPDAIDAVLEAADTATGWTRIQLTKACLLLAEKLLELGKKNEARRVYTHLRDTRKEDSDRYIRDAAEKALAAG